MRPEVFYQCQGVLIFTKQLPSWRGELGASKLDCFADIIIEETVVWTLRKKTTMLQ
jgi:hypothetical protein